VITVSARKRRLEIRCSDSAIKRGESNRSYNARVMTEESAVVNVILAALRSVRVMPIEMGVEYQVVIRGRVILVCIVAGAVRVDHGPRNTHGNDR